MSTVATLLVCALGLLVARVWARSRRRYARMRVAPYRTEWAEASMVVELIEALHKRLLQRWWRGVLGGQPSLGLELHLLPAPSGGLHAQLAVTCPVARVDAVQAALRGAYPNVQLEPFAVALGRPPALVRLKKCAQYIKRLRAPDGREQRQPLIDRLIVAMHATGTACLVQLALTPTPGWFERSAKRQYKRHERRLSAERDQGEDRPRRDRSEVESAELIYVPQFMVKVLGYGSLKSGLGFLPMMGVFAIVSFVAGSLYNRLGAKPILVAGAGCLCAAPFLLSLVGVDSGYLALVPGMVVMGFGVGLFYSTVATAGVGALDPSRASLAGGIVYMCQIAGGSVGLGLTTAIVSTAAADHVEDSALAGRLSHGQEIAVNKILAGTETGQQLLAQFPGQAARLNDLAKDALVAGISTGYIVVGSLAFLGLLVATFLWAAGCTRRRAAAATGAAA